MATVKVKTWTIRLMRTEEDVELNDRVLESVDDENIAQTNDVLGDVEDIINGNVENGYYAKVDEN